MKTEADRGKKQIVFVETTPLKGRNTFFLFAYLCINSGLINKKVIKTDTIGVGREERSRVGSGRDGS